MPEIHLTRELDGATLILDCCDPRYGVERLIIAGRQKICVLDHKDRIGIYVRETQAEIDAIMAVAHPEIAQEIQG